MKNNVRKKDFWQRAMLYAQNTRKKALSPTLLAFFLISILVSALVGALSGFYATNYFIDRSINPDVTFFDAVLNRTRKTDDTSERPVIISEEQAIITTVEKASDSVVSVIATKNVSSRENNSLDEFFNDPFFEFFFGPFEFRSPEKKSEPRQREIGAGSGFIVSTDGLVITNRHVVDIKGAEFSVITNDDTHHEAKVLALDPVRDLAILKIEGEFPKALVLGNSDDVRIGQTVVAIGNALGKFSNTVSRGVVSGLSRSVVAGQGFSSEKLEDVIQTDAAINRGNSGGPLLNVYGEVIGVNTAIIQGAQSIGFAIPINQAKKALNDVKEHGRIQYPFLGVRYLIVDKEVAKANSLPVDYGAFIIPSQDAKNPSIIPESPAAKIELRAGDIILSVNGKKITKNHTLAKAIQSFSVGDVVTLVVLSGGEKRTVTVKLAERPQK